MQFFPEPHWGQDPPYGASLNYWLQAKQDSITFKISNENGQVIRTIQSKGKPGLNRVWWNLRTDPTKQIVMQTKPAYADWVPLGEKRKRNASIAPFSVLVPPGNYTITFEAGDYTSSETIQVVKDPNSDGTLEDIQLQNELMMKMHSDMDTLTNMINKTERVRRQLGDLQATLSEIPAKKHLLEKISAMDTALINVESKMIQLKVTGTGQDQIRFPALLAGQLSYLATTAASSDFRPPDAHIEVYNILNSRLEEYKSELKAVFTNELKAFNQLLLDENVIGIITGQ
jgi:hypothetical protein